MWLRTRSGDEREIDAAYLDAGWLEHGYALTAHAAQGATVDRAFVLGGDDLYREWGYTAMTRHRDSATFYIVSPGSTERALSGLEDSDALMDDLRVSLRATRRQSTASETAAYDPRRETQQRIAKLAAERSALSFWARHRRSELDDLIARQEEALDRFAAEPPREPPRLRAATQQPNVNHDQLRADVLEPPAAIADLVGSRPTPLTERDRWTRRVARLLATERPGIPDDRRPTRVPTAAERTMDHDTGLDL